MFRNTLCPCTKVSNKQTPTYYAMNERIHLFKLQCVSADSH
jgi:hypothetical protein